MGILLEVINLLGALVLGLLIGGAAWRKTENAQYARLVAGAYVTGASIGAYLVFNELIDYGRSDEGYAIIFFVSPVLAILVALTLAFLVAKLGE